MLYAEGPKILMSIKHFICEVLINGNVSKDAFVPYSTKFADSGQNKYLAMMKIH